MLGKLLVVAGLTGCISGPWPEVPTAPLVEESTTTLRFELTAVSGGDVEVTFDVIAKTFEGPRNTPAVVPDPKRLIAALEQSSVSVLSNEECANGADEEDTSVHVRVVRNGTERFGTKCRWLLPGYDLVDALHAALDQLAPSAER